MATRNHIVPKWIYVCILDVRVGFQVALCVEFCRGVASFAPTSLAVMAYRVFRRRLNVRIRGEIVVSIKQTRSANRVYLCYSVRKNTIAFHRASRTGAMPAPQQDGHAATNAANPLSPQDAQYPPRRQGRRATIKRKRARHSSEQMRKASHRVTPATCVTAH